MQHNKILTVTELTLSIKALLEEKFPLIWISGEISNFHKAASGHIYFTLKDEKSQISSIMFKGQNKKLKFEPRDGMKIIGLGRISLYVLRGTYQIILEYLEPKGAGELQAAYEQLKAALAQEGLFDEKFKRPLPFLPKKISIITSPGGAVVHDIIKIIIRRFSSIFLEIIPVKVQGHGAEDEIVLALKLLNSRKNSDTAILARGGGSIEDLSAFNTEKVARAVFSSKIPIISAIGHETDFTIADFAADLRAPTPSAAAELVVPLKKELVQKNNELAQALKFKISGYLNQLKIKLDDLSDRLVDPKKKVYDLRLKTDDFSRRTGIIFKNIMSQKKEYLEWQKTMLYTNSPFKGIKNLNEKLEKSNANLLNYFNINLINKRSALKEITAGLNALSPTAILSRGYSITKTIPGGIPVKDSDKVKTGQLLETMLEKGRLISQVKEIK